MSKQDKSSSKTGADRPKPESSGRKNPGLEVVNIYGSGPVPVGLRTAAEPQAEDPEGEAAGRTSSQPGNHDAGKFRQPGSSAETKK